MDMEAVSWSMEGVHRTLVCQVSSQLHWRCSTLRRGRPGGIPSGGFALNPKSLPYGLLDFGLPDAKPHPRT